MTAYILRRLLLIIPTLFGIMVINFFIIQIAPGGPVEQTLALWQAHGSNSLDRITKPTSDFVDTANSNSYAGSENRVTYPGSRGVSEELMRELEKQYGFDKPIWERFWQSMWNYLRLDFGESFYRDISVINLMLEKLPVSISLGLWSTLIIYMCAIPLGIRKAVLDDQPFDRWDQCVDYCCLLDSWIFTCYLACRPFCWW